MNNIIIEKVSKILKVKKEEIKIVRRLLGGMSHYTYLVEVDETLYTIRLIGEAGNLYVDRFEEKENIKRIDALKLNNETVYFNEETGTKLARYIEGDVLTELDAMNYLPLIAKSFRKLHNSDIKAYKSYGLIDRLNLYESYNEKQSEVYLDLKSKWLEIYEKNYKNRKEVFCHNDAQLSNLVLSNNKVYMLDWEYSANNDPLYDIASFGEHAVELLKYYLKRKPTKEEIRDVNFYAMFQWLQWYQVAIYKNNISLSDTINFDFKQLANTYMERINELYLKIKDGYDEIK